MASPRDPHEVDQTLLPGAPSKPAAPSRVDTPQHPAPHDATIEQPASNDDGATLVSEAIPAPKVSPNYDDEATRMPNTTAAGSAPGTVVESNGDDSGATLQTPAGRTVVSGAVSGGISGGLSHDTAPISVSGPSAPSSSPSVTGTMIGRFALKGLHASGGLGEVFTARDTELNREVAVKRIKSRYADDPGSRRRFLTEAELTARLDHPGVVPVFGLVNDARGRPVYAMRFIRGETLKDEIDRYHNQGLGAKGQASEKTEHAEAKPAEPSAPAPPAPVEKELPRTVAFRHLLSRFVYVCQAIAYAHEKGIIHRDIKPANVMVGKFGEVLVVDWGLAKSLADGPDFDRMMRTAAETGFRHDPDATDLPSHMTTAGTAVGTPSYMPPEQAAGQIDKVGPKADVYSLGATLFAILTGKAPFTGKSAAETLDQVRRGAFAPPAAINTDCPKPLEAVCLKAMALNPDNRYATALALATDVERWLSDEPVSAYKDPFTARAARWARRHPARVATGVSLLLAGVLAAGGIAWAIHLGEQKAIFERNETAKQRDIATAQTEEAIKQRDKANTEEHAKDLALVQVKQEKVLVGRARDLARSRYEKAVDTYGTLVHDLDDKLRDRAGMQAIRKKLLLNATDGLKKLVEEKVEGDIGADRTLVAAHRQMGEVYQIVGRTTDARVRFLEAERIARLVKRDAAEPNEERTPEARAADIRAADRDLARSLDRLAGIQVQAGDTNAALTAIKEAITIFEHLAANKADPVAQQELAAARAHLSTILMEHGDTGKAADECKLALAKRMELSADAPNDLERKRALAASLDALAGIQLRTGDATGAGDSAAKCLKLRADLAPNFPPDHSDVQRELAAAHTRLGEVCFDRALMTAAATKYEAGLKVLNELVDRDPENASARADRALLYGRLGHVQIRTGDIAAALENTKKSKEQCEQLEKTDPKSAKAQRDLALARERYGDALLANDFAKLGLGEYEASQALLLALQDLDPGSAAAKLELARGWERIGDGKIALNDAKGAVDAFGASVKIREAAELTDTGSASVKRDLAVGRYKQANAYCVWGKPDFAGKLASSATRIFVDLARANPGSGQAQRDIALAFGKWGQVLINDGHPTGALIVWQSSLDRFLKLAEADRDNVQAKEEVATAWERLAGFYAELGNNDQALASARQAFELWDEIGQRIDARTKAGKRRLALARIRCGDINAELRQLDGAADWYTKALADVEAMKDDPLLGPVYVLANEKLTFVKAVRAGLNNPKNLTNKEYDKVRHAALRTVAMIEVHVNHVTNAAGAADELAAIAKNAQDHFAVAKTFAECAARNQTDLATKYAKSAVDALKKAIDAGFHDTGALNGPEWDAVRRHVPALAEVQADLIKRNASNH